MTITAPAAPPPTRSGPAPILDGRRPVGEMVLVGLFVALPTLALVAAVPLAWGWGLGWTNVVLAVAFYFVSCLGVTVGFHRYFTHGSFKANRPLRIALAIAGSLSLQGSVLEWVGDHRRHHAFSDKEGDPHSPWLYGTGPAALVKGFVHAHLGWLFDRDRTNMARFAPDLRPPQRPEGTDRHLRRGHPRLREARRPVAAPCLPQRFGWASQLCRRSREAVAEGVCSRLLRESVVR